MPAGVATTLFGSSSATPVPPKVNLSVMTVGPFLKRLTIRPTTPGTSVLVIRLDCWRSCGDTLELVVSVVFLFSLLATTCLSRDNRRVDGPVSTSASHGQRRRLHSLSVEPCISLVKRVDIASIVTNAIRTTGQLKSVTGMLLHSTPPPDLYNER